jgi:DNA polymerase-3 subunit delta'
VAPRRFADIVGQDEAIGRLRAASSADRLPHGLLFAGPMGVGKGTTATVLARGLLCAKPVGIDACGRCESCLLIDAGTHPDFHVAYRQLVRLEKSDAAARDLSIDVIREHVLKPASHTAMLGRGKVFIIEEADRMSDSAQNALLKTLEEPSTRTVLVLLTDKPDVLLPTIRSRCQRFSFAPLSSEVVENLLRQRGCDPSLSVLASRIAEGSLGLALRWIEDGVVQRHDELTRLLDDLWQSKASATTLVDFLNAAAVDYAEKQQARDALVSKDQGTREGIGVYLQMASRHLRLAMTAPSRAAEIGHLCRGIDAIVAAERNLLANVNVSLVLLQFCSALRRARPVR